MHRVCWVVLLGVLLGWPGAGRAAVYYASPSGGGNGQSASSPFRISSFWSIAQSGDTLWLLDGTYQSDNLQVPVGQSGGPGALIAVKAVNDGAVLIDSQYNRVTLYLNQSTYWNFEGMDVANSASEGISLYPGSGHNIVRRVCAWNAHFPATQDDNRHTMLWWNSNDNLFEDLCLFGWGRNNFNPFEDATQNNVSRRIWMRWDGWPENSGGGCPGGTYQGQYHTYHTNDRFENLIVLFSGALYDRNWVHYAGFPCPGHTGGGSIHRDGVVPGGSPGASYFGNITYGYDANIDIVGTNAGVSNWFSRWVPSHFTDLFIDSRSPVSTHHGSHFGCDVQEQTFDGSTYHADCSLANLTRITSILNPGQPASTFDPGGTALNECRSLGACPNFYTGQPGNGAAQCYEYQNGALTTTPLWPWRMDDRIKQALARAGITPTTLAGVAGPGYAAGTVTSEIVDRYGAVPAACLRGSVAPPPTVQVTAIPLSDINTSGKPITSCWGGLGIDHNQQVYIGMGIGSPESDDVAIFKYDTTTGQRSYLTTLKAITQQQGNADANETFAKVHADMQEFNGKMYIATHDFHDTFAGKYHRGGHFFAYDLAAGTFEDLSKTDPGGVSAPHQGIIGMDVMAGQSKLIGFTFPSGDVVAYDLNAHQSAYWTGQPNDGGISRHIWTTDDGTAYISYGQSGGPQPVYAMQVANGATVDSGLRLRTAQIPAAAHRGNSNEVYLYNWDYLYLFHKDTKQLESLGEALPAGEVGNKLTGAALALSNDGKSLFLEAEGNLNGTGPYTARLYQFDLQTRQSTQVADITDQILAIGPNGVTGSVLTFVGDSQGRLYSCATEGYFLQIAGLNNATPVTTPAAWWHLDAGSGTSGVDAMGNAHPGTLMGTTLPTWVAGRVGPYALHFTSGATFQATPLIPALTKYSWAMWFKGDTAPSTTTTLQPFFHGSTAANFGFSWSHGTAGADQAALQIASNGAIVRARITATLSANVWYHLAATYDGANLRMYLNGQLQSTVPVTSMQAPTGPIEWGLGVASSIDEPKIWPRALSDAEVLQEYGQSVSRPRHKTTVAQ